LHCLARLSTCQASNLDKCLADFGCFMRVAHRNALDDGIYGLLDFWKIFGKMVF